CAREHYGSSYGGFAYW
nr:immunoglobulin heavy chain junction region [Mus musculus]NSM05333.1 immunoglobulin heavy chain junction region [Mus musculus]